ncbi:MAG: CofH family radical SAM protein [Prevotellaceae bacterium]|jgi:cyclic dehypoxanthinyl futalosine synthase|nr:CofH family radical SAM protein [Prevotellaceae bacterium]
MHLDKLYKKALQLEDLDLGEAMALYCNAPTAELMCVANKLRQKHVPGKGVSWQIDRNINITNICISGCKFCNFHCKLSETDKSYSTTLDEYIEKINELYRFGGDQVLLQGGLHPGYGLAFYSDLFCNLKQHFPTLKLHALGPPEIAHIARLENMSYSEVLKYLLEAGLDSLPGAGAEILSDRVRKILSPTKPDVQAWLDVMCEAHKMNLATSATMMFGHIETPEERIEHLLKIRNLQNERPTGTYGFLAFICWPVQSKGTPLARQFDIKPVTATEYVRMLAISRIVLNNITNIQASWLSVGKDVAELCLHGGANDFGSIMLEENVMSSAGAHNRFDAEGIQAAIRETGFEPWRRNQKYEKVYT